jgi:hypothetical protein
VLLAALGSGDEIEPNVEGPVELSSSDAFLLCSDGWWSGLDATRLATTLARAATPEAWLDAMGAVVAARADPRQDNHWAIACWVGAKPVVEVSEDELETVVNRPTPDAAQHAGR